MLLKIAAETTRNTKDEKFYNLQPLIPLVMDSEKNTLFKKRGRTYAFCPVQ